ncbi:MAG TPA: cysteine--tRNA ligase [Herpetosiphonaceae bacterium]|nr:cysteine--tRNA ligase [Herpetosiphonaceae bacterium]
MTLEIYNTLSRRKEPFETLEPGIVRMYVCGPTVYDKAHIGHGMSAVVFDVIRRYLEYRGYKVRHVQNYTDVDDKIINRANAEGRDPQALAEQYIAEFNEHLQALNILPATVYPRATDTMPAIIELIGTLIDRGAAYEAGGDVYFRVRSFKGYGKLSGRRIDDMRVGARIAPDERKEDPLDFALWKAAKPGEPAWPSPWSPGRPGWHIECSAMNLKELGPQIDIHGGGNDLIFPHHENEIAQSESATGERFARFWIHNGMLQLRGEKMSKSLGNLVTIEEFLQEHEPDVLRLLVLSSSYRAPLTFDDEVVEDMHRKLDRLRSGLRPATGSDGQRNQAIEEAATAARMDFEAAMDDDFNTAGGLAALFELVRAINTARDAGTAGASFEAAQATLRELAGVLGLTLEEPAAMGGAEATPFIELLVRTRAQLRAAKQWALADQLRKELGELGVILEDSPTGTTWRWER